MKRLAGFSLAPVLLVLTALLARVDVATKPLWSRLERLRAVRGAGLGWREAYEVSGYPAIAGGSDATEATHTAGFILSEANGALSRDEVTILSGQDLQAGAVLGKVTASGKYRAVQPAGVDGSQTAVAILYGAVDASSADTPGTVINRDAEVRTDDLVWPGGTTANQKATALAELLTLGIKAR